MHPTSKSLIDFKLLFGYFISIVLPTLCLLLPASTCLTTSKLPYILSAHKIYSYKLLLVYRCASVLIFISLAFAKRVCCMLNLLYAHNACTEINCADLTFIISLIKSLSHVIQ